MRVEVEHQIQEEAARIRRQQAIQELEEAMQGMEAWDM